MANPNRAMAYVARRSPVDQKSFRSWIEAERYADDRRAQGFEVRVTKRRYGSRKAPITEHNVFSYERVKR